ncbi:MAG TPA: hypothetical protein VH186_34740 [Chloroflexia bacterium]|nr:hypothetical protein [Chloroflexia bacterium]
MKLYRPVGLEELRLIYESGMCRFPPRLPEQPIFYPVLNFAYAEQIARGWNTKSGSLAGYVTEFNVEDVYLARFEPHIVGSRQHEELWIPAEQLEEFNEHITGCITVSGAYFGQNFKGYIPDKFGMKGRDAVAQFILLGSSYHYSPMDFWCEIRTNNLAVFLHYPFWQQHDFSNESMPLSNNQWLAVTNALRDTILEAIRTVWSTKFPQLQLPEVRRS